MTGTQLWDIFLAAQIPDAQLRALGEDIGYKRDRASAAGLSALAALAAKSAERGATFTAVALFGHLKSFMPGIFSRKALLEGLADDYAKRRPFASCKPDTRNYLGQVAGKLPAIAPKVEPPPPPPPIAKLEPKVAPTRPEDASLPPRVLEPKAPPRGRFFKTVSATTAPRPPTEPASAARRAPAVDGGPALLPLVLLGAGLGAVVLFAR